jgi:hypothetical protein
LVHLCTCKAAANRSNVCKAAANRSNVNVSGKKLIIKYSLFLRQCKVYQPARSQRKKGEKKTIVNK